MRRLLLVAIVSIGCLWIQPVLAAEIVNDLQVAATLDARRHLTVEEAITYDFGDTDRHGIYRTIPVTYRRDGGTYRLRLTIERVTRDGAPETYETKNEGDRLTIKIGSANRVVTGRHIYRIRYSTDRAINFFSDGHSELYWNVTGNEWPVMIERASFALTLPSEINFSAVSTTCYTGEFGATEQACRFSQAPTGFTVASHRVLRVNEGLTAAFAFPAGSIRPPSFFEHLWQILEDNGVLFFPLVALVLMHWLWWKKGRDPARMTVIPEYSPPRSLSPALLGSAITNGTVPPKTVTATIVDLARRGYLKIHFGEEHRLFGKKQTFRFVRQNAEDDSVTSFESRLLNGLFAGGEAQTLEDLKTNEFYENVQVFKKDVEKEIDRLNVFVANPNAVRGAYFAVALLVGALLFLTIGSTILGVASAIATGIIIFGYGIFMPTRTLNGVKLLAQIEGFKWFLSVTEKDRLAFTDAPERTPELFHKFLPCAIALGVEEQWAKQFASLTIPPPNWAEGNLSGFTALWLISNLSTLHSTAQSVAYASPSQAGSGGSGFSGGGSGGGFGGGGGGSW